ncbi:MAG: DUF1462 family protein [Clostridiales bacterium]|nr:DUF1462 family protein [Clostridiales bacterium]
MTALIRDEVARKFGDAATVVYRDAQSQTVREHSASIIKEIETRGLLYPVTVIDGVPIYDGAVSYPGIIRALRDKLERAIAG